MQEAVSGRYIFGSSCYFKAECQRNSKQARKRFWLVIYVLHPKERPYNMVINKASTVGPGG